MISLLYYLVVDFGFDPFHPVAEGGGELVNCVQSRELDAHALPTKVYPAAKLQRHCTCGCDFKHSL